MAGSRWQDPDGRTLTAQPRQFAPAWLLPALPWLIGLVAAGIAAKNLLTTHGDFGIYLDAARELRDGTQDLCRARADSGPWLYPHWVALPLAVLQSFLSDAAIRVLWSLLLGLGTTLLLLDLRKLLQPFGGLSPWQWCAFGMLFQRILAQNLTHGQLSLWVGTLVTRGLVHLQSGRQVRAGAWLAVAAAAKLTPFLFLPALPLLRQWRATLAMALCSAGLILLLPWPFCGTEQHLRHLGDFFRAATGSLAGPGHAAILEAYAGPSVAGTLDYLLQPRPLDPSGRTTNIVSLSDGMLAMIKLGWSLLLLALLARLCWRWRHAPTEQRLPMQAAAVTLAFSFFAPLTRVYHLTAMLLPCALFCRGPDGRRDWLWWATATGLLLSLTLRQKWLLGTTLWRALDAGGLLHFALVALLLWLSSRHAPGSGAAGGQVSSPASP